MSFEQAVRVPLERIGAVIGREGATKRSLEADLGVKLWVDSKEGLVTIKSGSVDQGGPIHRREGHRSHRTWLLSSAGQTPP